MTAIPADDKRLIVVIIKGGGGGGIRVGMATRIIFLLVDLQKRWGKSNEICSFHTLLVFWYAYGFNDNVHINI
jgi:hypothetical protein